MSTVPLGDGFAGTRLQRVSGDRAELRLLVARIQLQHHPIQPRDRVYFLDDQGFASVAYEVISVFEGTTLVVKEVDPQPRQGSALVRPVTLAEPAILLDTAPAPYCCGEKRCGPNRYNEGCRCDYCRKIHRERMQHNRMQRHAGPIPETVPHGKASTYSNWGCRCRPCKDAHNASTKVVKARIRARRRSP